MYLCIWRKNVLGKSVPAVFKGQQGGPGGWSKEIVGGNAVRNNE